MSQDGYAFQCLVVFFDFISFGIGRAEVDKYPSFSMTVVWLLKMSSKMLERMLFKEINWFHGWITECG